jgi:hypothetical protein
MTCLLKMRSKRRGDGDGEKRSIERRKMRRRLRRWRRGITIK